MRARLATLALAGLLAAAPAAAQELPPGHPPVHPCPMMGGHGGMHGMGAMQGMMHGPMMILHLREPLELTEEQVQRIEAIHARVHPQVEQAMQEHGRLHQQAMAALMGPTPDPGRHDALLRQAADRMLQAHSRMARAVVEAHQVLTPQQRENLRFAMRAMRSMMQPMHGEERPRPMRHRHRGTE